MRTDDVATRSDPDLGVYLQPDPEHQVSATTYAGPQAYAYAGGNPLTNVDPLGLYFLDASWGQGAGRNYRQDAAKALEFISNRRRDPQCPCTFDVVYGSRGGSSTAFGANLPITFVPGGQDAFSPWPAYLAGALPPTGNGVAADFAQYGRIQIGERIAMARQFGYLFAHEIAHTSFLIPHGTTASGAADPFDTPHKIGVACSGVDGPFNQPGPLTFDQATNDKIRDCCDCNR